MRMINDDDTPFSGTFTFDGYCFGDRLLEGVIFHADSVDGEIDFDSVRISPNCADYFEQLNQKKWLKAAREFIKGYDGFDTLDGKSNVWTHPDDRPMSTIQPVEIFGESLTDIIGSKK